MTSNSERKMVSKKVQMNFWIERDLYDKVLENKEKYGVPLSWQVNTALREYFARRERDDS